MANGTETLVLATQPLAPEAIRRVAEDADEGPVAVLSLGPEAEAQKLPGKWRRLAGAEFLNNDKLREGFLAFLDAWPRQKLAGGKSFDELFARKEGYSLWWTRAGIARHPSKEPFAPIRTFWICAKAVDTRKPRKVLILAERRIEADLLACYCRNARCEFELLPGSAEPGIRPYRGRLTWLAAATVWMILSPLRNLIRVAFARMLARPRPESKDQRKRPAIVLTGSFPRHVRLDEPSPSLWYWRELHEALSRMAPEARARYLMPTTGGRLGKHRMVSRLYHTAWPVLRNLVGVAPVPRRYPCLWTWLTFMPRQLAALARYYRLEGTREFQGSFRFMGTDLACLYVPFLRSTVADLSTWEQSVESVVKSLRSVGNVKVVVVDQEFYGPGIVTIAAARKLGIPTIGAQHGAIYPMHLIYTLPAGQVTGSPLPDHFAVYGEYAKEVVSKYGAFPAERVWITGGSRFDHLVNNPPSALAARERLGLVADRKIIFVAAYDCAWFQEAVRAVFQVAAGRDDLLVCLKTHPGDPPGSLDRYRAMADEAGATSVRLFSDKFDELLAACDILLTGTSTAMLEAIILGRRAICVNFSGEPEPFPYAADGGAIPGRSPEEVRLAVEKAVSPEAQVELEAGRRRFLLRHAGPSTQGRAAETLAGKMVALMKKQRPA